jgi:hypothetical protein
MTGRVQRLGPTLILLALSTFGCFAPSPVVRLHPRNEQVVWHSGRAIVARETPGYRVAVAFDHLAEGSAAMRLEVVNSGSARFDVDPARMQYSTCTSPTICGLRRPVIDPEERLIALDESASEERASQANDAALGGTLMLLNVTASAAALAAGKPKEANRMLDDGARIGAQTSADIERSEHREAVLEAARIDWSASALRRTTLFPGQSVAGFVYLPVDTRASIVWLGVELAGQDIWFTFDQVQVSTGPPPRSARRQHLLDESSF